MHWINYIAYALVATTVLIILACVYLELTALRREEREEQQDLREGFSLEVMEASIEGDMPYDEAEHEYLKAVRKANRHKGA
jgi:hypothetical protein